jgi:hypothetical protein
MARVALHPHFAAYCHDAALAILQILKIRF